MNTIKEFRGKYWFLSNFSDSKIEINGLKFKNAESAFHSFKDSSRQSEFQKLNPSEAKKFGRRVRLRDDWEEVKLDVMYDIVKAKFTQNKDLKLKLVETNDSLLIEGTTGWHDNYYGNCECDRCRNIKGQNHLGKILMKVREELK